MSCNPAILNSKLQMQKGDDSSFWREIMSADNGIYILETPTSDGGLEYRVAHLQAVENVEWSRCSIHGSDLQRGNEQIYKEGNWVQRYPNPCPECLTVRGYSDDPDIHIANAREMWLGDALSSRAVALEHAADMLERLAICEYGISFIKIPRKF
jgi:hypothetical protein